VTTAVVVVEGVVVEVVVVVAVGVGEPELGTVRFTVAVAVRPYRSVTV
jgi:hypothetical protein